MPNIVTRLGKNTAEKRIVSLQSSIKRKKDEISDIEEEINALKKNITQREQATFTKTQDAAEHLD